MTDAPHPREIPGRAILAEVRDTYRDAYAHTLQERGSRVMVVRFESTSDDTVWAARMEASRVSAEQKVRTFTALGATSDHIVVPDAVELGEIARVIHRANDDPQIAGIIVQAPPPQAVLALLNEIDPAKDIDSLGIFAPRTACATADGIVRIAEPYLPDARIAVVGSSGFVGSGVVALLRQGGHDPILFEDGDDLRRLRDADVVLSTPGSPWLLTPDHIHSEHRLVVDSGFTPHPDGPRGDLHPDAAAQPHVVTPVPGGIGPVEMAVLAERVIQQEAAPALGAWRFHGLETAHQTLTTAHDDVAQHSQQSIEPISHGEELEDGLELD
ncbi:MULTISPECIES: tetrahydrofolate dehydrogenase/cyclohydrolase catalytic domain-containing protein [unclassified Pseudonocardia]|uniref:tetrahydrofolate dehydrogenase/cyclohydrolase catalytic domain-containing protein n=1 Tax=unclassified Pseudonocardia TaxID=2619320 RepID=UPI00076113BC|nr:MULTISPECIES: tetrahydrofolate dehydrogenase/cyclohydrolase catalytic domain-containing protein [unclassified Pseudonocardia]